MSKLIEQRKKVYSNLPTQNLNGKTSSIVLVYNIDDEDFKKLNISIQNFLCKSLSLVYNKEFVWNDTFLENNDELIIKLPNKTPNGILTPKKETINEFVEVQKNVNNIFNNLNLYKNIKKLLPPNIRYKSLKSEPEEIKSRPYYTGKMHSDAWVGHKGDSIFMIGALGDIKNNTVELNSPIGVHDNYLDKAESFDEGNTRYDSLEYLGLMEQKTLVVMDHACLHKTYITNDAKPRISLDIAVLIDSEYSHSNDKGFDENVYQYYNTDIINEVGKTKFYEVNESIFQTTKSNLIIK
jgi:hypothetical protein